MKLETVKIIFVALVAGLLLLGGQNVFVILLALLLGVAITR
jgi:hypothetical protein